MRAGLHWEYVPDKPNGRSHHIQQERQRERSANSYRCNYVVLNERPEHKGTVPDYARFIQLGPLLRAPAVPRREDQ